MQLVEAGLTHRVGAAQADGLVATAVELIVADGTGQELRPLGRLHWHPATTPRREAPPSSGGMHVNAHRQQLRLASVDGSCERQELGWDFVGHYSNMVVQHLAIVLKSPADAIL